MDEITLFLRRYSFEDYSPNEWWVEPEFGYIAQVLNSLSEYTNSLPDTATA